MKYLGIGGLIGLFLSIQIVFAQKNIIPQPQDIFIGSGKFPLSELRISSKDQCAEAIYLKKQWGALFGKPMPETADRETLALVVSKDWDKAEEAYQLEINNAGIRIVAGNEKGVFYGIQTLLQLCAENREEGYIAYLLIDDYPKFLYRGMHLDVSRHFFSVPEVKKFLDYIAAYKINRFHWHLTDDQGWRMEIKSHPKLTEVGGFRKRIPFDGNEQPIANPDLYGGYYTQEQIKEVVAYASSLHIEVIPEIEMPGHALAALAAYPELSCTGGPFEVWTGRGVTDDIFCAKEETFQLLEDVIDEVVSIFPSHYIHIGGDEAPKKRWKECTHCQQVIKREALEDEHELQSYFITRMEKYINGKGKKIIGWDEILEGGLAPNATVMSWTGIEGGIHAARSGHDAIMTPASHLYFDYYQGNPQTEPLAFSADLRLAQVYSYNPIPEMLNTEERQHILGTQATMWTEYIPNFKQVEYMLFPRLMALSEVAWGTSNPIDYKGFENRVISHFSELDRQNINYSRAIYEIRGQVRSSNTAKTYVLSTAKDSTNIRYTLDGSEPNSYSMIYQGPIRVNGAAVVKAAYFENGQKISTTSEQIFVESKATNKHIMLNKPPEDAYAAGGAAILVDGILGSKAFHKEHWLGFIKTDVCATVDLVKASTFSEVGISLLENRGIGVHYPARINISISSDNHIFEDLKEISVEEIRRTNGFVKVLVGKQKARFVRITLKDPGKIPVGSPLPGSDSWIFIDEIAVD
ncbi:beta-N-acetylhexosaminidase [Sphingobacterium sp. LRF_L2]|uniref:beta-N-acetylhexosaminidase n=1 Tax=Sphingobacterium sp. LRF_L2 TaxID=3369421 RepID=UPI003F620F31